jgi:hypothetical protein
MALAEKTVATMRMIVGIVCDQPTCLEHFTFPKPVPWFEADDAIRDTCESRGWSFWMAKPPPGQVGERGAVSGWSELWDWEVDRVLQGFTS